MIKLIDNNNERFKKRAKLLRTIVLFMFLGLMFQLFRIQILMHSEFNAKSEKKVLNKKEVLTAIRKYGLFNVDGELNKLDKMSSKRYYKLLENLTYNQRTELEKELKDLGIKKKEIFFEKKNKRIYPNEELLRPIIGFMAKTDEGEAHDVARFGIEKEYDSYLDGGTRDIQKYLSANRKREIPTVNRIENKDKKIIHHKDHNRFNNNPNNLLMMNGGDHLKYHQHIIKETIWKDAEINKKKISFVLEKLSKEKIKGKYYRIYEK